MNIVELFFSELDKVVTEAAPEDPVEPAGPGLHTFNPDTGEKPVENSQIRAHLSHNGQHYHLYTHLKLEENRSLRYLGTSDIGGGYKYKVTAHGFKALEKDYVITYSVPFD